MDSQQNPWFLVDCGILRAWMLCLLDVSVLNIQVNTIRNNFSRIFPIIVCRKKEYNSGEWIWTIDLRVMSPSGFPSYPTPLLEVVFCVWRQDVGILALRISQRKSKGPERTGTKSVVLSWIPHPAIGIIFLRMKAGCWHPSPEDFLRIWECPKRTDIPRVCPYWASLL